MYICTVDVLVKVLIDLHYLPTCLHGTWYMVHGTLAFISHLHISFSWPRPLLHISRILCNLTLHYITITITINRQLSIILTLPYFTLLYSPLLSSTLLYFYSTLLHSTTYSTLLYPTLHTLLYFYSAIQ